MVLAARPTDAGAEVSRQVAIDDFIVDFYCDELKLVIEIDGDIHDEVVRVQVITPGIGSSKSLVITFCAFRTPS